MTNAEFDAFFDSLSRENKRLFRMLQSAYNELGRNVQMFSHGHLGIKQEIAEFMLEKFNYDLTL